MKYIKNFKDEIICDYLVDKKMKKVWNAQLEILDCIDKICHKHNIKYYGDSGTLIGAIRHKGYIPWDDDIDIAMLRDDYNKFLKVAKKELKKPLFLQTVFTDEGYFRTHAQIRNSDTTAILITEKDFNYKFNQGIFVDIFPLDKIPDDEKLLKKQLFKMKVLRFIMQFGYQKNVPEKGKVLKNIILRTYIVPLVCKLIVKVFGFKRIFKKYEKISSKYNDKECKRVSYIAHSLGKNKHIWDLEWFKDTIRVDFENQKIDIPVGYDERLKKEYGDYMKIVRASSEHGDVIFDPEISYKKYLKHGGKK